MDQTRRENLMRSLQMEAFTEHTHTDLPALREDLEQTRARLRRRPRRKRGPDLRYGAAIVGPDGVPVACVSVSIPLFRRLPDPQQAYVAPLLQACATISRKLAGPG
jgi:DNA-binding IclR family transcriptional regulator